MPTERELVAIIRAHRREALGADDGELSNERADALDHYHGRPYGDEMEGRSQVVSRDLSETVEWIMPALMRIFLQSGNIAEFTPEGPEDEELAQQESDYTNYVFMKDNDGFIVLYDFIKDALLLKNGYVKHYWEEREKVDNEEWEGLSEDELAAYMMRLEQEGAEVEIKEQEIRQIFVEGQPLQVIDVKLQITRMDGKAIVEAAPPEEMRVSKRCRGSLQESPFTEHVTTKTRSDLIEMGMDEDFVYSLPSFNDDDTEQEQTSRSSVADETDDELGQAYIDRSMDEIEYCEAYIKVDWDDDGIAELRKVVTVADRIPEGDEWNEPIDAVPVTGGVIKRVPHRHVGESLDDELADLQRIKTTLQRQMLDNVYRTNNAQYAVNERVHLADFLRSTPGGVKRIEGTDPVNGSYETIETPPILNQILPAIDYVDTIKENRTGINRTTTGLDPDVLKESTKGAFMENLNRASQKVEMIARMLSETGIKEIIQRLHDLLMKHQDKERVVKLRGKYVPVSPQNWKDRTDLTVRVGLGSGNEEEKRQRLMMLSQLQDKMAQFGLVGPKQAYNLFADMAETMNYELPEKYAMDPNSQEFQQMMAQRQQQSQNQPNPMAQAEQVKGEYKLQSDQMQAQMKAQQDRLDASLEHQRKLMEMQLEQQQKEADRRSQEAIEAMKAEIKALVEGYKVDVGKQGIGAGVQDDQ